MSLSAMQVGSHGKSVNKLFTIVYRKHLEQEIAFCHFFVENVHMFYSEIRALQTE